MSAPVHTDTAAAGNGSGSGDGLDTDTDIAIVGYGPVGQTAALLLASRGHRVTVLERFPRSYPMPRAVSFDGESARILAATGVGAALDEYVESSRDYVWHNADGQSSSGWTSRTPTAPAGPTPAPSTSRAWRPRWPPTASGTPRCASCAATG